MTSDLTFPTGTIRFHHDDHGDYTIIHLPDGSTLGPNRPGEWDPQPWWMHDAMHLHLAATLGHPTSAALHHAANPHTLADRAQLATEERTVILLCDLYRAGVHHLQAA